MNNATLVYKIKYNNQNKVLRLYNKPLMFIDNMTSNYLNEEDFINNFYNKDEIYKFIKENGNIKGKLVIDYKKDVNKQEEIKPLFNQKNEIVINDDFYNNQISEVEKARKLLFNSKNQMFTKLLLSDKLLNNELNKVINLDEDEIKYSKNNNIKLEEINNKYYVSFKTLLEYRVNSKKLGMIRNAYQDMLSILKNRLQKLDVNTYYFYNRQLRLLIDKYREMISITSIKDLKINNKMNNKVLKYSINK